MTILRYTCTNCGLVTRVQEGQDYRACGCFVEYTIEVEGAEEEAPKEEE